MIFLIRLFILIAVFHFTLNRERKVHFHHLGLPRLDAARFLSAGVPSLSFATYGSRNIYHLPGDNLDIIKPEIMEDMAQLLFITVVNMGNFEGSLCPAP